MKILYDCFSCSPYYGSDEGIGWTWPYMMSKYHEVWALVRTDRKEDIERFCKENPTSNLHFVYCDIPKWMNIYYYYGSNKTSAMRFLMYQYLWQYAAIREAKRLHKIIGFDLVHHVCTNDFRILGFMYKLKIPYIIGPIGGAQETPKALYYYVRNHQKSEKIRTFLNRFLTGMPSYKRALNSASRVYVSNRETWDYIEKKMTDKSKIKQQTEVAYLNAKIPPEKNPTDKKEMLFMWAGRMEYRKGIELLLDVAKLLPAEKTWQIILCGTGTEKEKYESRVKEMNLTDRVVFTGKLPYEKVQELYEAADVFVFPSLRETTGTVIIEAMAHGVPVICLKQGGAVQVLNEECGWLVGGDNKDEYLENFSCAMLECIEMPELVLRRGQAAKERIKRFYTWERYIEDMSRIYYEEVKR